MEQNLVSVIIPIYNVEPYLNACIASVCAQTYRNIEIILVDDGSTDRSPEICDEWAKRDDRICVIHKENRGVSSARNAGMNQAHGKYVTFVDSDDITQPNLLDNTVPYLDTGFDIISFGYNIVNQHGNVQSVHFPEKEYQLNTEEKKVDFIVGTLFRFEIGWNVWNSVFRIDIIRKYEIEFADYKKVIAEDQLFYLCYLAHCSKIKVLDRQYYQYCQHSGSLMSNRSKSSEVRFGEKNELAKTLKNHYEKWDDCKCLLAVFPLIHYLEMERLIQELEFERRNVNSIQETVYDDIKRKSDLSFFIKDMCDCSRYLDLLRKNNSAINTAVKLARSRAMGTGHSALYKVLLFFYTRKNKNKNS